ncbi:hypothetical protein ACIO3S_04410 [Nocardioides sp. NPDC087217]|uniref:hypothetical protein n=1 Tax=Nocardioides sp. NPDC087217 TaxID=3364335 RepID=UPI0037F7FABE
MRSVRLVASIVMGLLAVVIVGVGAVGPGDPDGEAAAEMESLRSAPACDSQPTEPAACIWEGEFEYVGSDYQWERGGGSYSIDLRDARPDDDGSPGLIRTVDFDREGIEGKTVEGLTYGAPVTATLWRGRIIEVRIGGRELPTSDYPEAVPEGLTPVQGTFTLIVGAAFLLACGLLPYVRDFRARRAQAAARNGGAGD